MNICIIIVDVEPISIHTKEKGMSRQKNTKNGLNFLKRQFILLYLIPK